MSVCLSVSNLYGFLVNYLLLASDWKSVSLISALQAIVVEDKMAVRMQDFFLSVAVCCTDLFHSEICRRRLCTIGTELLNVKASSMDFHCVVSIDEVC